ncbi:MAG TPA: tetratricopeptide repeat protein [Flavobacteriaceae bacterium]|nr:tetratricopeptide repeat protein [Flavobacteriaceae bacterium]
MMLKQIFIIFGIFTLFSAGFLQIGFAEIVPEWVKNTAKWYGDGKISEIEFLNTIQFLINNGILNTEKQNAIPKIEPDDTKQELLEYGVSQLELKNNLAALQFFNKALDKDPRDVKALVDKGIVLARQGNYKDAKAIFDKAIEISESQGKVNYKAIANAGIVLSIFGDPDEAIKYFDRVLDNEQEVKQETLLAVLTNKGVTLLEQGKYEESISYFDRVLKIEPDRIGGLVNKANALQELNRTDEAFPLFIRAHELSNDPLSWKPTFVIIK